MRRVDHAPRASDPRIDAGAVDLLHSDSQQAADGVASADGPPELTVDEVIARHRDEWILMRVTGFDEEGWPDRGYLLAHSPRRGDVSEALAKEPPRSAPAPGAPYQPTYVFNAFPRSR